MASSSELTTVNTPTTVERKIKLQSSEGDVININQSAASLSEMLKNTMEDIYSASLVPVPNVNTDILKKVIDYCMAHSDSSKTEEELKGFDTEYVKVDQETLFDILMAANFMDIRGLFDLTCQTVADMMIGKTPEEIREIFNIVNDYSPEEEDKVRQRNAWAFE